VGYDISPLHFAKSKEAVDLLLEYRAVVDGTAHDGKTALMAAAKRGNYNTVQRLIEVKANLNIKCKKGETALSIAQKNGHKNVAELIRKAGAVA
jgi:ankyrin repeat protein